MPNYGLHKYGRFKYGKYRLSSGGVGGGNSIGPHIRHRIRTIDEKGRKSDFLTMCKNRISIPSKGAVPTRIRADKGQWITTQNEMIRAESVKVRIRSIESDGGRSPWVYGDRGTLSR